MDNNEFADNKERYLFHVEEFKKFDGSIKKYCNIHGLRSSMFGYYKNGRHSGKRSVFSEIKITPTPPEIKLPPPKPNLNIDPTWLAKLIHNLLIAR